MAEYVYPAVFHANDDGTYAITYPDLPGCVSEGKTLADAMRMAQSALTQRMEYLADKKQEIPAASAIQCIETKENEFVNLIRVDIRENRAVKRTVSIPKWMDDKVAEAGLSLSRVLQDALLQKFQA